MAKKNRKQSKSGASGAGAGSRPAPREPKAQAPAPKRQATEGLGFDARPLALVLATIGVLLTAYLTGVWLSGAELAACSEGSSCDLVQSSRWSTLLGLPMALWGMLTYIAIGFFVWRSKKQAQMWTTALYIAVAGVGISAYLQAISVFELDAVCMYCVASAILMTVICAVLAVFRPRNLREFRWAAFGPSSTLLAVAIVIVMHLHFSGAFSPTSGPEKGYLKALAVHLDESGAKFYGASWCPHCQEQKWMFEASVKRLPYVECSPNGRGTPISSACQSAGVQQYPTWVIGGQRFTGILAPERLAELSGFKG